jgi:hypothetical protein
LQVFPFSILFDDQLKIRLVGASLRLIIPFALGILNFFLSVCWRYQRYNKNIFSPTCCFW